MLSRLAKLAKSKYINKCGFSTIKVTPIPLFKDNYSYLVHGLKKQNSMLIDPADAKVVFKYLKDKTDIIVSHILLTHKHWDHAAGVPELIKLLNQHYTEALRIKDYRLDVVSGIVDNIPNTTISIQNDSLLDVNEIKIRCIPTPCHTKGAICYYMEDVNNQSKLNDSDLNNVRGCYRCVFTGDTVFIGGCGRFFEGNASDMLKNFDVIMSLPNDTYMYCGHEYTLSNLEFSLGIEWENPAYNQKLSWAKERRAKGLFTIPSTISDEKQCNVFARCRNQDLQRKLGMKDPEEVMRVLREYKNENKSLRK